MLPDDFFSFDRAADIFKKEERQVHPDEKYDFHYVQDDLKPRGKDELLRELGQSGRDARGRDAPAGRLYGHDRIYGHEKTQKNNYIFINIKPTI
jgi:hypothetical protein